VGRIPEESVREIRSRVDIVDLIGRYVVLKKAGRNFKGLCPFHDEKTPSFNVSPDRQIFHCFGCGEGGDAIGFLMKHEALSFPEAARVLAGECGIAIPEDDSGEKGVADRLLAAADVAQSFYRSSLGGPAGEAARDYLARRGLDRETIDQFGIGFAPDRWDAVVNALARKGISGEIGEQAGLLARKRGHYDRLRGRVVFPISDVRGRIIGFGGRALSAGQEPKYLNTPESPIFRKREVLYGFPFALEAIRRAERAIICEGYFDRLALHRAGLAEGLATCGTALTLEHARQLRRRTRQVVLLFDGDEAGRKAVERALEVLLPEGLRVRCAALPPGEDPDTLLAARGAEALRALVESAGEALEVVTGWVLAAGRSTPAQKADAVGRLAPLVALIADPVERSESARRMAIAVGADSGAVEAVVRRAVAGSSAPELAGESLLPRRESSGAEERHLRQLAGLVFRHPAIALSHFGEGLEELLPDGSWKAVILQLLDAARGRALASDGAVDLFRLEERLDDEARSRLREVAVDELPIPSDTPVEKIFADLLRGFEKKRLKARAQEIRRRMSDPKADQSALLSELQEVAADKAALGLGTGVAP
jgi:DNA primase